jgi:predicted lipoprotein with Yx(FWY)xxD motif
MSNIETGGPAFPQQSDRVVGALSIANSQGMTLRDYFAAKAMQAIIIGYGAKYWPPANSAAAAAYEYADFMLKERSQS